MCVYVCCELALSLYVQCESCCFSLSVQCEIALFLSVHYELTVCLFVQ